MKTSGWKRYNTDDKITHPENSWYITYSKMDGTEYLDRNYFSGGVWNIMEDHVLAYISQDELILNMGDLT